MSDKDYATVHEDYSGYNTKADHEVYTALLLWDDQLQDNSMSKAESSYQSSWLLLLHFLITICLSKVYLQYYLRSLHSSVFKLREWLLSVSLYLFSHNL